MALAAMGSSESVELPLDYLQGHKDGLEWASQLAEANHPETGDWLYDDPIELAKAIRKGPDMPPVQPVPEYPETLPCPVLLEPGLRFGKGIKTSTMLAALARRAVHESDMAALSTEERAEFQARIENFKALIAQPVPVVPKSISVRDAISALESEDAVTTIGQAYKMGWNACRAAMLQELKKSAGTEAICRSDENVQVLHTKSPAQSDCCPAQNSVTPAQNQGWIPVSERMPEREVDVQVYCPDKKEQMVAYLERNELDGYFRFATWRTGEGIYCQPTHWMQLPAGPREGK